VRWRVCVDSAPLLDKAWAGAGWSGLGSAEGNVIPTASGLAWFLSATCFHNLEVTADAPAEPSAAAAAACNRLLPTGALRTVRVGAAAASPFTRSRDRDARLRRDFSAAMGPWWAGLRHCQDVCPLEHSALIAAAIPICQPKPWGCSNLKGEEALAGAIQHWTVNCGGLRPGPHQALDVARNLWLARGGFFGPLG